METIGYVIIALGIFEVIKGVVTFIVDILFRDIFKKWNTPNGESTATPRKSFKERLAEKQRYASSLDKTISDDLKRYKDISEAAIKLGNTKTQMKCTSCNGSGILTKDSTPLVIHQPCPQCKGTGYSNPPKQTGT